MSPYTTQETWAKYGFITTPLKKMVLSLMSGGQEKYLVTSKLKIHGRASGKDWEYDYTPSEKSLLTWAQEENLPLAYGCNGKGTCRTCKVSLEEEELLACQLPLDQIKNTIWEEAGGVAPLKAIVINEKVPTKAPAIRNGIRSFKRGNNRQSNIIGKNAKPATTAMCNPDIATR